MSGRVLGSKDTMANEIFMWGRRSEKSNLRQYNLSHSHECYEGNEPEAEMETNRGIKECLTERQHLS